MISERKFKELEVVAKFLMIIVVYFIVLCDSLMSGWQRGAWPAPIYPLRLRLRKRVFVDVSAG